MSPQTPYVKNSRNGGKEPIPHAYLQVEIWALLAYSLCVLFHSFIIHKTKFGLMRIITDVFGLTVVISCALFLTYEAHPSSSRAAYMLVMGYIGCLLSVQSYCYIALTYSRYRLFFRNDPAWIKYSTYAYVFFVLFLTWVPFYTILPIFIDTNDPTVLKITSSLYNFVYLPGMVVYDIYYTGSFLRAMRFLLRHDIGDGRLLLAMKKCVIHTVLSLVVAIIFSFPGLGFQRFMIYMAVHLAMYHFLFNWKIEQYFPSMLGVPARPESEQANVDVAVPELEEGRQESSNSGDHVAAIHEADSSGNLTWGLNNGFFAMATVTSNLTDTIFSPRRSDESKQDRSPATTVQDPFPEGSTVDERRVNDITQQITEGQQWTLVFWTSYVKSNVATPSVIGS